MVKEGREGDLSKLAALGGGQLFFRAGQGHCHELCHLEVPAPILPKELRLHPYQASS